MRREGDGDQGDAPFIMVALAYAVYGKRQRQISLELQGIGSHSRFLAILC